VVLEGRDRTVKGTLKRKARQERELEEDDEPDAVTAFSTPKLWFYGAFWRNLAPMDTDWYQKARYGLAGTAETPKAKAARIRREKEEEAAEEAAEARRQATAAARGRGKPRKPRGGR
jgi:hypothetical protein